MNKTTLIATLLLMGIVASYRIDAIRQHKNSWELRYYHALCKMIHSPDTKTEGMYYVQKIRRATHTETSTCTCQIHIYGVPSDKNPLLAP